MFKEKEYREHIEACYMEIKEAAKTVGVRVKFDSLDNFDKTSLVLRNKNQSLDESIDAMIAELHRQYC